EGNVLAATLRRRQAGVPHRQARSGKLLQQQLLAERQQILPEPGVLQFSRASVSRQRIGDKPDVVAQRKLVRLDWGSGCARTKEQRRVQHFLRRLRSLQRRRGRIYADD